MVGNTLCPAGHILGSQNMYGRAEGIADHYWPWAAFFYLMRQVLPHPILPFRLAVLFALRFCPRLESVYNFSFPFLICYSTAYSVTRLRAPFLAL